MENSQILKQEDLQKSCVPCIDPFYSLLDTWLFSWSLKTPLCKCSFSCLAEHCYIELENCLHFLLYSETLKKKFAFPFSAKSTSLKLSKLIDHLHCDEGFWLLLFLVFSFTHYTVEKVKIQVIEHKYVPWQTLLVFELYLWKREVKYQKLQAPREI